MEEQKLAFKKLFSLIIDQKLQNIFLGKPSSEWIFSNYGRSIDVFENFEQKDLISKGVILSDESALFGIGEKIGNNEIDLFSIYTKEIPLEKSTRMVWLITVKETISDEEKKIFEEGNGLISFYDGFLQGIIKANQVFIQVKILRPSSTIIKILKENNLYHNSGTKRKIDERGRAGSPTLGVKERKKRKEEEQKKLLEEIEKKSKLNEEKLREEKREERKEIEEEKKNKIAEELFLLEQQKILEQQRKAIAESEKELKRKAKLLKQQIKELDNEKLNEQKKLNEIEEKKKRIDEQLNSIGVVSKNVPETIKEILIGMRNKLNDEEWKVILTLSGSNKRKKETGSLYVATSTVRPAGDGLFAAMYVKITF